MFESHRIRTRRIPPRPGDNGHEWIQEEYWLPGQIGRLGKRVCVRCQRQPFECHGETDGAAFAPCRVGSPHG